MCHVLIIEDEPLVAMLIQDALEEAGATSFAFAGTERDAVELAAEQCPALITSDVRLIEGTGPAAVQTIREKIGDVPVIFITGNADECQPACSSDVVLSKPISFQQITAVFQQAIAP